MTKQDWRKRFDEYKLKEYGKWKIGRIEAKQFIQKELTKAREEERKKINKLADKAISLIPKAKEQIREQYKAQLLEKIEKIEREFCRECSGGEIMRDRIIEIIKEL
ncbi:MAG: hypothetical protein ACTSQE_06985 [Candidatus Heimdallarchaeaceae archaeon]